MSRASDYRAIPVAWISVSGGRLVATPRPRCAFDGTGTQSQLKEIVMNKNQVAGAAKDVAGKIERKTGELIGNDKMQVKGAAKQVEGKLQKAAGNAQHQAKHVGKH
jgi:uncharacterized protein YjbJ (UPF0337 family)